MPAPPSHHGTAPAIATDQWTPDATGDPLFPGGPGNTWNDPERFEQLMDGLERRLFGRLPDETWVYPGHGNDTTLGTERPKLPEWRERGW